MMAFIKQQMDIAQSVRLSAIEPGQFSLICKKAGKLVYLGEFCILLPWLCQHLQGMALSVKGACPCMINQLGCRAEISAIVWHSRAGLEKRACAAIRLAGLSREFPIITLSALYQSEAAF